MGGAQMRRPNAAANAARKGDTMAVQFYMVRLTPINRATQRFALYELRGNTLGTTKLFVVWPNFKASGKLDGKLLPFQVHSKNRNFPAYHFKIDEQGYPAELALANALANRLRCEVEVIELSGTVPRITSNNDAGRP